MELIDAAESADEEYSGQLSREQLERKLEEARERLDKYKGCRQYMEEQGLSQLSLVDTDAKLMKNKNGFQVSYNAQTAVDSETHIIRDYNMTNKVTDHGLIEPTVREMKRDGEIIEAVADRGYEQGEDMIRCLEDGMIPHVMLPDGKDTYELELDFEEAECDPSGTKSRKLQKKNKLDLHVVVKKS